MCEMKEMKKKKTNITPTQVQINISAVRVQK